MGPYTLALWRDADDSVPLSDCFVVVFGFLFVSTTSFDTCPEQIYSGQMKLC